MRAWGLLCAAAMLASCIASAATFTVINTNDSGAGSLRDALTAANTNAGPDTIQFAIPGAGVHVINVASFLPTIEDPVTIDGYTQPGAAVGTNAFPAPLNPVLQVQISGLQAQLVVNAGGAGTVIRGLVLNQSFEPIRVNANNVTITGNFIGTDATGATANGGSGFGIRHSSGNTLRVGGPSPADRNLIADMSQGGVILDVFSGSTGHLIQGNFIGTNRTGTASLAQVSAVGMSNTNNAQVLNNLISGNPGGGLDTLNAVPNTLIIRGNLIGTQADGTSALPNGNFGGINLRISNATVGGSGAGEPNTIAFNNGPGVWVRLNSNSNPIIQNVIYGNTLQGITLNDQFPAVPMANDAGDGDTVPGNRGQNKPVLNVPVIVAGSATISGTLNSQASRSYRIELFANAACGPTGFGQGQTFIGNLTVVTDGSGNATIGPVVLPVPAGQSVITATATDLTTNDTSEFSQCPAAGPATTTGVVSSLNPSTFGQSVTFTATVSGGTSPTGTVQFFDGATSLGTVALAGSTAALSTSALAVGTHPITATYSGDIDDTPSTSAPLSQVVNAAGPGVTATSLVSSLNPYTVGQAVTFTATVSGGTSPTGNVQFREGATVLATVPLAGATAAFTTSALSAGVHVITADYTGDVDDSPSTSALVNQVVNGGGGGPQPPSGVKPIPVLPWPLLALLAALLGWQGVRRK
jgi:hypothetical protein